MSNSGNPALKALAQELSNPNTLDNDYYSACNVDYTKLRDFLKAQQWNWGFGREFWWVWCLWLCFKYSRIMKTLYNKGFPNMRGTDGALGCFDCYSSVQRFVGS